MGIRLLFHVHPPKVIPHRQRHDPKINTEAQSKEATGRDGTVSHLQPRAARRHREAGEGEQEDEDDDPGVDAPRREREAAVQQADGRLLAVGGAHHGGLVPHGGNDEGEAEHEGAGREEKEIGEQRHDERLGRHSDVAKRTDDRRLRRRNIV